MFYARIADDEDLYDKITVDSRTFYRKKAESGNTKPQPKKRRRYSDQFRDPVFEQREVIRKLRMIASFKEKHGDLESIIDKWKDSIYECINVLHSEYEIQPLVIFKAFGLTKYGFSCEEFGVEPEEEQYGDE